MLSNLRMACCIAALWAAVTPYISGWDLTNTLQFGIALTDLLQDPEFQQQVINAVEASQILIEPLDNIQSALHKHCMNWNSKVSDTPGYAWAAQYGSGTKIMKMETS